jgi:Spy/CpxP family protein refolding chaperone
MKQSVILTLLIGMLVMAIGLSWARPGYGRYDKDGPCDGPRCVNTTPGQGLDLSEEQRSEIKALRDAEREKLAPLREQMRESREAMRQALQSDTVDETRIRELARAHTDLKVEMHLAKREFHARMESILTPEQIAMRDERRQNRAEMRSQRHGKDGKAYRHGGCGNCGTPTAE